MSTANTSVSDTAPVLVLIVPPNSYRTFAFLDAASQLGIKILVVSEGEHAIVSHLAGGLHVDLNDPAALEQLLAYNREHVIGGIVATDDSTVELGSRVSEALGLPHNPPAAAQLSRRKDLARACLADAGIPIPQCRRLDLKRALAPQIETLSYPCVVKPVALSASRGVIRVDNPGQLLSACGRIEAILIKDGIKESEERYQLLVEAFISGPEFALEGILYRGKLHVLAIFAKPDPLEGPFFEESYYISPAQLDAAESDLLVSRVQSACEAYGLKEGPIHAELRLAAGDAWIMEVASRTIGGHCGRLLKFGTGQTLETLVIAHAMGRPLPVHADKGAAGVLMIPIPKAGILRRVEGIMAAQRIPFIEQIDIALREGYELVPLPEGAQYLGFVFARAPSPAEVEAALRAVHAQLNFVIAPLLHRQQV